METNTLKDEQKNEKERNELPCEPIKVFKNHPRRNFEE